jgi:hypothetical protein
LQVDAPGDFFDEHGREALGAEFFVHAEEVDLGGWEGAVGQR